MFFDWISIVFLAILIIAFVIGLSRGFIASISVSLGAIIGLVVAFFAAKSLASSLMGAGVFNSLNDQVLDYIKEALRQSGHANYINLSMSASAFTQNADFVVAVFEALKIPQVFQSIILNLVIATLPKTGNVIVSEAFSTGITYTIAIVISFIAIFAMIFIVFIIVKIVAWALRRAGHKRPSMLSRIAGGIIQLANSFLFIYVIAFVLAMLASSVPAIGQELTDILHLGTNDWSFAKWLVENNAISHWISGFLN